MTTFCDSSAEIADFPASSEAGARKLVGKLAQSGQLRASFLLNMLRQGRMELFDHGFATLLQLDVEPLRKALYADGPRSIALACRAAGIDRSAFGTVLQLCRCCEGDTALSPSDQEEVRAIFSLMPKGTALERLRAACA